jgi:hypothetical protein
MWTLTKSKKATNHQHRVYAMVGERNHLSIWNAFGLLFRQTEYYFSLVSYSTFFKNRAVVTY